MTQAWRELGTIIMLQVQLKPLKEGTDHRVYKPHTALHPVDAFDLTKEGITAVVDGQQVYDAHHMRHPLSRYRQSNPISIGLTSHYQRMQTRFGSHISLGIAGENIIVETEEVLFEDALMRGVAIQGEQGLIQLDGVFGIPPCKPFSKFCLNIPDERGEPESVKETLQFLLKGTRGFCAEPVEVGTFTIRVGDKLWVPA
ncbi:MAG: hypothetical protein H6673_04975 [Anaerolineales bacterium]|nr:hypothetical protein [Anaerolineales bacterium]